MTTLFSSGIAASGDINRQEFIQEIEKAAKKGNAISFNRSITDEYLKDLLRDGSIFKERLSRLQSLNINFEVYSKISDAAVMNLVNSCPKLSKINLKSCVSITDRAIVELSKKCQYLEEINLSWCDISEKV